MPVTEGRRLILHWAASGFCIRVKGRIGALGVFGQEAGIRQGSAWYRSTSITRHFTQNSDY
jgi:hypothetical protein